LLEKSDKAEPAKHGGGHGGKKSVEGEQPEIFRKIKNQEPLIRDLVISIISEYPMATLVELAGKSELKEKIKQRLMEALQTKSLEVFFTAFTLQ
jgi:flagellar basal body-associated protein FliL